MGFDQSGWHEVSTIFRKTFGNRLNPKTKIETFKECNVRGRIVGSNLFRVEGQTNCQMFVFTAPPPNIKEQKQRLVGL